MILAPWSLAFCSEVSIRGWFVPGLFPKMKMSSLLSMSSSVAAPLPTPSVSTMATPDDSWHMFEQSGRLFVPNWRANSCRRKAGSLVVFPEV